MTEEEVEETYSKIGFILLGILVVIMFLFILNMMTGGSLFQSILCMIAYFAPVEVQGYLGCQLIPI